MLQMPMVASGPQRTGGFRLKRPSTVDLNVPAADPADRALLQPWEHQAVVRLGEILTYADLETLNCEDDYRSKTPRLGYVGWREIWKPDVLPEAR
jgi:hypothetical protein